MRTAEKGLIGLGVCLIGGALIWHGCGKEREPIDIPLGSVPLTAPPAKREVAAKKHPDPVGDKLERKIGLQRGQFFHDDKDYYVSVMLRVVGVCFPGDYDAIEYDALHKPSARLLVTIERTDNSGSTAVTEPWVISPHELSSGLFHQFVIPRTGKTESLGLYVCLDSKKAKGCGGKEKADFDDIFAQAYRNSRGPASIPPDRIYYFQFLSLDPDGEARAFADPIPTDKQYGALGEYLAHKGVSQSGEKTGQIGKLTKTLRSFPVGLRGSITVPLPHRDPLACKKK